MKQTSGNKKTKTVRKPTVKRRKVSRAGLLLMGVMTMLLCAGIGFYLFNGMEIPPVDPKRPSSGAEPEQVIEKTGSGANVDFTAKTQQLHQLVDEIIANGQYDEIARTAEYRSIGREKVEGWIKWTTRKIAVRGGGNSLDMLQEALNNGLAQAGGKVLAMEPDYYNEDAAIRLDVGFDDVVEGENFLIISERIFLLDKPVVPSEIKGAYRARLALVIDDFGYNQETIDAYSQIDCLLTYAVLPNHPYSKEAAESGHAHGRDIMLHLPMEALSDKAKPEAVTLTTAMSEKEVATAIKTLVNVVPHVVGVNNHQGSKATSSRQTMQYVMREMKRHNLFFIDSKTSGGSIAYAVAREYGVPTAVNELFIDNNSDVRLIKEQLRTAADMAVKNRQVIVIGHARMNTARAIKEMLPEIRSRGIDIVLASSLLQ